MTNERAYTPSLVLHVLRNPHGWSVEAITAARLQAADEIERLRDALKRVRRVAAEGTTHTGMISALGILVDRALNPGNGPLPPDYTYHSHEPGAVTRLPAPGTTMTRLSDIADELIRQLRKQGMEKMQAVFDGMRLRIDPWPEQPVATPGATPPGEDSVWQSAESSRPRELLAQQMEPDTSPLTHQEIFSAVHHHAAEIVKLTAAVPAQCTLGASRDASPADLVGALQDVVHTDPGPVRAGRATREWHFDRYRGGKLMAQGVKVHAPNYADAYEKAVTMLFTDGNKPTDELRLSERT